LHVDEDHFLKDVIAKSEQHLESEVEVKTQRKVIETLKGELEAIIWRLVQDSSKQPQYMPTTL
ncbi:MAG: hypothetical protein P4L69_11015, partial [Desulfosporosinus sp.]|nr:hypothetical protein [Desulfosporosinus sp.]